MSDIPINLLTFKFEVDTTVSIWPLTVRVTQPLFELLNITVNTPFEFMSNPKVSFEYCVVIDIGLLNNTVSVFVSYVPVI